MSKSGVHAGRVSTGTLALAWAVLVVACGDVPMVAPVDGGIDAAIAAAAALPSITPCASGWREIEEESGLVTCEPWAAGGHADCVVDEVQVPGTPACAPVGRACSPDGWPSELPTDRTIVYVDDDGAPGGDGSTRARAIPSLADAVLAAPDGAVIAVATGTYDDEIGLARGQSLMGACAASTVLTSSVASDARGVINLDSPGVEVRDISIVDAVRPAFVATGGDTIVASVVVRGATLIGLYVAGAATVHAHDLVVSGTRATADGAYGRGIQVQDGGHLLLERAAIVRNREVGVAIVGASSVLEASDLAVLDSSAGASGEGGIGILVEGGARLVLARAALERNTQDGLFARDGATADVEDVVIRDTEAQADGTQGLGLHIEDASVVIRRALLARNRQTGIFVAGPMGRLDANAMVLRDTAPRPDGTLGRGIEISAGSSATITGAWLERNTEISLFVNLAASSLVASDLTILDSRLHAAGFAGRALAVEDGATAVVTRLRIERSYSTAIFASRPGTSVEVRDVVVRDTRPPADGSSGRAVGAQEGARVVVERALLEDSTEVAVIALGEGSRVEARDVIVRRVRPDARGAYGLGIWSQDRAEIVLEHVRVEETRMAGVGASAEGSLTATDLAVSTVLESGCADTSCADLTGGLGIMANFGGRVAVTDFEISDVSLCGVVVGHEGLAAGATALDLTRGVVRGAPVGACVQIDGYDSARLRNGVEYRDVGVPLRATSYTLPSSL